MTDNSGISLHTLRSYRCVRCKNTFEAERHVASTCPICGFSSSEILSSEKEINY